MKILLGLAAVAALAASAEPAWDWGTADDQWANAPDYQSSKALCRQLSEREPPTSDWPDAASAESLKGCDSEALYYGIGVKADPERARQCAILEAEGPEDPGVFAGRAMLMTIYANGRGAARDLDLATHLACGIEGAPMESHGRVTHLAELKSGSAEEEEGEEFHFCDDITSGYAGGLCAGHYFRVRQGKRDSQLAALTASWSGKERQAFTSLQAAQEAFAEAHADGEVDASGTLRSAFWIQAKESLAEDFLELLQALEAGKAPRFTNVQVREADAALNAAYRETLRGMGAEGFGTVKPEGVRDAQRAWLRYRDSFVAFAAVRYARHPRGSLAAELTRRRTEMLLGAQE
jgi:uncharacterized protein YecT (DUF1311 family)